MLLFFFFFFSEKTWTYRVFPYPSFSRYSLKQLYHIYLNYFNLYKDHCSLIEYMLPRYVIYFKDFHVYIIIYNPYKNVVKTFIRHISHPFKIIKLIKN